MYIFYTSVINTPCKYFIQGQFLNEYCKTSVFIVHFKLEFIQKQDSLQY